MLYIKESQLWKVLMTENVQLEVRETRLTTLAVDGDYSGSSAPVIAVYLKDSHPELFSLGEHGVPVYQIQDVIIPPKKGLHLNNIEIIFSAPVSVEEDAEEVSYSLSLEAQYVLPLLPLHMVGETYIAVFAAETRVHPKNKAISNLDLQILLNLAELGSDEFKMIANKIATIISPRALSSINGIENIIDSAEIALLRDVRGELLLILAELASGSEKALLELFSFINPLNAFEEKIMVNQHELDANDARLEALTSITDRILSRTNIRNVIPRGLKADGVAKFQEEYNTFNEIMENLDIDGTLSNQLDELSLHDRSFVDEHKNHDALSAYLNSPITKRSLPLNMAPLADKIDFGGLYETDWSLIDSISDFIDDEGNYSMHSFGENIVVSLIASIIRIGRISEVNRIPPFVFLISILSDNQNSSEEHWELVAFSERLAKGDTSLFKDLITIFPKNIPMSQLMTMSYLGFIGFALAGSIIEEKWSKEILHIALHDNQIMLTFIDSLFDNIKEITEQYRSGMAEQGQDFDQVVESSEMIKTQIIFQAIQISLAGLGETYDSGEEIASAMIDAVLKMADLNTGKKTLSPVNSQEWLMTKKEYLDNLLNSTTERTFEEN